MRDEKIRKVGVNNQRPQKGATRSVKRSLFRDPSGYRTGTGSPARTTSQSVTSDEATSWDSVESENPRSHAKRDGEDGAELDACPSPGAVEPPLAPRPPDTR